MRARARAFVRHELGRQVDGRVAAQTARDPRFRPTTSPQPVGRFDFEGFLAGTLFALRKRVLLRIHRDICFCAFLKARRPKVMF